MVASYQGWWVHVLNEMVTPSFRISSRPAVSGQSECTKKVHSLCNKVVKFSFEVKAVFIFSGDYSKHCFFFFLFARIFKVPLCLVSIAALHKIKIELSKNPNKGC